MRRVSLFLKEKAIGRAKALAKEMDPPCPWAAVVRAGLDMYLALAEEAKERGTKFRLKDGRVRL